MDDILELSTKLNYDLFEGNFDSRKGIFRLCESIREEMSLDPSDASNIYVHVPEQEGRQDTSLRTSFYVLYEKLMRKQLEVKDEENMMLTNEISNLWLQCEDSRKHCFCVPPNKESCLTP